MSTTNTAVTTTAARCDLRDVLDRIGDTWTVLVVAELAYRPYRFRELQRAVDGISQRMLTLTLRRLERDGLVSRTVTASAPVQVSYALTELGESLTEALRLLSRWAVAHRGQIEEHRNAWDTAHQNTGCTFAPCVRWCTLDP